MLFSTRLALAFLTLAVLAIGASVWSRWAARKVASAHWRGRCLRTARDAEFALDRRRQASDPGLQLGQHRLPSTAASSHLAFVGATGSGKTLLQRLLMQSALPLVGSGHGHRALIYDAKQDVLSVLAGMSLNSPIRTLNPLDARSVGWDMAADIRCPASALQVASILIPEAKTDNNPFFSNAARHLLYGVLTALIQQAEPAWTFRHVLLVMRDPAKLRALLSRCEHTSFLLQYFEHPGTFQNILSTVLTQLAPFEVIAAAWDQAEEVLSLEQWTREESILVLGNDEANRAALEAMNRLIFRRVSELVLSQDEILTPQALSTRTWFFLDEVREAGKLESLSRLLTKGRSKGAAVVLGFQDIAGLQDVYGKEVANELVGQCGVTVILRLNSPETAAWASRLIGSREVLESRRGYSRNYQHVLKTIGSTGESVSHGVATRPLVLDSEIMDLHETSFETGLTGYVVTPLTGAFREHLAGEWLKEKLASSATDVPNFAPRPAVHQYLRPWSEEDEQLLGLVEPEVTVWN
ncbi:MAG: type IV secretion system DNA-binding domain-containing protein [Verrucomicrobiales bacterium]|nr:type IV secretion system DNA-binding domain-containing protein [Verrucomicrobiales bacterium]